MSATVEKVTAGDVEVALRAHFDSPKYAVITGVRNGGGWEADRTCDALVMGTWQSVGRDLHGVEIKVSRSDWLREIQDVTKSDAFAKCCDYWWIAACPNIVKLEELPATWGLLETVGKGMKVRRPATVLASPHPISRGMLASLCRRVVEQSPAEDLLKAAIVKAHKEARAEAATARAAQMIDYDAREAQEAKATLDAFREATGVYLSTWNMKENAEKFKRFVASESALGVCRAQLDNAKGSAQSALDAVNEAIKKLGPA